jgi:hypothetical protein
VKNGLCTCIVSTRHVEVPSPRSLTTHVCCSPKCKLERTNALNYWAMKHRTPFDRPAWCSHSLFEDVAQNSIRRNASGLLNLNETWNGGDSKHSIKIDWLLSGSNAILILHEYWSRIQPPLHPYSLPTIVFTQTQPIFRAIISWNFTVSNTSWRNMGSGCMYPRFLDLGTSWRCVVSFTPRPFLTTGNSPWYPLDKRLIGPQGRSGRYGEENILDPTRVLTQTSL